MAPFPLGPTGGPRYAALCRTRRKGCDNQIPLYATILLVIARAVRSLLGVHLSKGSPSPQALLRYSLPIQIVPNEKQIRGRRICRSLAEVIKARDLRNILCLLGSLCIFQPVTEVAAQIERLC